MQININRNHFAGVVKKFAGFVAKKSTIPILGGVRFQSVNGKLFLTATDLEKRLTIGLTDCDAEVDFVVLFSKLHAQAQLAKADDISLEFDGKTLLMTSSRSKVKFNTFSGADYPDIAPISDVSLQVVVAANEYLDSLKFAGRFVTVDDSRRILHGVFHSIKDGKLTLVASNGRGLGQSQLDVSSEDIAGFVIPAATAQVMDVFSGQENVTIHISDTMARCQAGDMIMDTQLVQGHYPNVDQVIQGAVKQATNTIVFDSNEFAATAAPVYAACGNDVVHVKFGKEIVIHSQGADASADNTMPADSHTGDEGEFIFNAALLGKAITSGKLSVRFGGSDIPVFFNYDNKMALLMPLRMR